MDRYANEENGVLACTRPDGQVLHLNRASYHFEFLKLDSDEAESPGRLARVVLTDLHNRAMPMIRYDTGDLAIVTDPDENGAVALARHRGAPCGRHPHAGWRPALRAHRLDGHGHARTRYRAVPAGAGRCARYRLTVVLGEANYSHDELADGLREVLGPDARIEVETVPSIAQAPSGKRRVVFREWSPEPPVLPT